MELIRTGCPSSPVVFGRWCFGCFEDLKRDMPDSPARCSTRFFETADRRTTSLSRERCRLSACLRSQMQVSEIAMHQGPTMAPRDYPNRRALHSGSAQPPREEAHEARGGSGKQGSGAFKGDRESDRADGPDIQESRRYRCVSARDPHEVMISANCDNRHDRTHHLTQMKKLKSKLYSAHRTNFLIFLRWALGPSRRLPPCVALRLFCTT